MSYPFILILFYGGAPGDICSQGSVIVSDGAVGHVWQSALWYRIEIGSLSTQDLFL